MTTPAQIIDWISHQRGVCIDRTGHYGAQAPDLVNDYAAELYGLPHIFGHGHDVAGNLVRSHDWEEIAPDQPAEFGLVLDTTSMSAKHLIADALDLRHRLLPNRVVGPALVAGALLLTGAAAVDDRWDDLARAALGAVVLFALFLVLALI